MIEPYGDVYLAARYSRREEMLRVCEDLEQLNFVVTSRWIYNAHQAESGDMPADIDLMADYASEDLLDLRRADYVVSFQEVPRQPSTNRGGRHVEFGYALALCKQVIVVGPLEHVFTALPDVERFGNWSAARLYFERIRQDQLKLRLQLRYRIEAIKPSRRDV